MARTKLIILLALCLFSLLTVNGQSDTFIRNVKGGNSFASDINGQPMYQKTEYIADGSPYLYDDYCFAEITTMDENVYTNVSVKFNLQENLVLYRADSSETEMLALTPIKKIKFYSYVHDGKVSAEVTLQGYNSAINSTGATVYAILEDGPAKLFKEITVTYTDAKPYGEATITRTFKKNETYYALLPGKQQLKKIEKNKTSIVALFESKQAQVASFIDSKRLNCRSEQDIISVFSYYNSI